MNDQSQLMNPPPPQMMNQPKLPPLPQITSQPPRPQVMNPVPSPIMNQTQLLGQSRAMNHPIIGMGQPQVMNLAQSQALMNQPLMMNSRGFYPNPKMKKFQNNSSSKPNNFGLQLYRSNWKGKKITSDKRLVKDPINKLDNPLPSMAISVGPGGPGGYNPQQLPSSGIHVGPGGAGGHKPPAVNELQSQNRLKTRSFYPKKKFNNRYVPYAPRNTTSFIIRAKKSGGIAELVSPCPVTPAVLPTPMFSPSREVLGDMAKEEWGVDGYGSMKGLIRLRSDGHELEPHDDDDEVEGESSESDVEEHVEVERRLDHDLSRFEMIYPNHGGFEYNNVLENRVDDQDTHIMQLEEENLTLKERLFLIERDLGDLRRRLQFLERQNMVHEDVNEEVMENESENNSEAGGSNNRASFDPEEENNHVDTEDAWMEDAKQELNHKSEVGKTEEESVDARVIPTENKFESTGPEGRELGEETVAERQDNESKHEEAAADNHSLNEKVSEKQNDESRWMRKTQMNPSLRKLKNKCGGR